MSFGVRELLRDGTASALFALGITHPARRAAGRLTIATFHRVLTERQRAAHPFPGLAVTPEELAWLLEFFTARFRCGTLGDSLARWQKGEESGRPLLAITFDDGQTDNFLHARPLLARAGVRATFFVPVGSVERKEILWHERLGMAVMAAWANVSQRPRLRSLLGEELRDARAAARVAVTRAKRLTPPELAEWLATVERAAGGTPGPSIDAALMSWDQLQLLVAEGHEIGSHSLHHSILPRCDDEQLEEETLGSRRLLESRLGTKVESFCYPNGDHDVRTVCAVRDAGYRSAVTTRPGLNAREVDPYRLRRYDMAVDHLRTRGGRLSVPRLAWRLGGIREDFP